MASRQRSGGGRRVETRLGDVAAEFEHIAAIDDGAGFEMYLFRGLQNFKEKSFVSAAFGRGCASGTLC